MGKLLIMLGCLLFVAADQQDPLKIELAEEGITTLDGNLNTGEIMSDLTWAWDSSNACFVESRAPLFSGKHVLYTLDLPTYTELEIELVPKDPSQNMSLYAYQVGQFSSAKIVPDLKRCVRCEADFKLEFRRRGRPQDHTRLVKDILALNNPFQVVIGVAGAEGLETGDFTLNIKRIALRRN